jgi:hypothetical protein
VNLLGAMHRNPSAEEARQHLRSPPLPAAGEESMGEISQQVGLQVNFPIVALEYFPLWN